VVFAMEIRNGLHFSAQVVLEQLVGLVVGLGIPGLMLPVQEQLVQEEVVVLGILLLQQLPGPSNLLLRVCKTDTGRSSTPSK
jgi:hydrogenase/urease accessory protein HupE